MRKAITMHAIVARTQKDTIWKTLFFLKVSLKPEFEQEKPIIPEVIISAIDIGIP